jgi:hypothetical protein
MKSFRSFQDRLYETVLRHDKQFCLGMGFCFLLLEIAILAMACGFTWAFCFATLCAALGDSIGVALGFGILRYLRRRYEKEFFNH